MISFQKKYHKNKKKKGLLRKKNYICKLNINWESVLYR